ncbi:DUF6919 domain-containing protein [Amycolatopsis eburnea]|uniref:DUF6919 domain-containing protein n=1 Tax=Amycolatopsis eburnea TaxID=2267691 RepID=A0A3R9KUE3_9PSEU|nr:hypothetical protein [Amycolatopsis eburnea]RSD26433.1 hypothetical protein EIY87_00155 [Amycolatopsis eburnea]
MMPLLNRVSKADRRRWLAAETLLDLGRVTADWLEDTVGSQPGYQPGYGPDPETEPLIVTLARVNRAGFLTAASQPGMNPCTGYDGATWSQRAAVEGFLEEHRAAALADRARDHGLTVVLHPPAALVRRHRRPLEPWTPVTLREGLVMTGFGGFRTARDLRSSVVGYGGLCSRTAVAAVTHAAQLTIVDLDYRDSSRLWELLDEWADEQGSLIAELDPRRADQRLITQLLAALAATPRATAFVADHAEPTHEQRAVLILNPTGVNSGGAIRWPVHEQDLPLLADVDRAPDLLASALPADQTRSQIIQLLATHAQVLRMPTSWDDPWTTEVRR